MTKVGEVWPAHPRAWCQRLEEQRGTPSAGTPGALAACAARFDVAVEPQCRPSFRRFSLTEYETERLSSPPCHPCIACHSSSLLCQRISSTCRWSSIPSARAEDASDLPRV